MDDKRQITTIVPVVAFDRVVLPTQVIFQGKTDRCLPVQTIQNKFPQLSYTYSTNHWSSIDTMKSLINLIVPDFKSKMALLGLSTSQCCIINLDCWSVHKSAAFRTWMAEHYPWIFPVFVSLENAKLLIWW
eukprot:Pompholyxophrys_punicea_v1_NODE_245_length_2566_cov_4.511341.p2 type:complete len:131 gc:universal NODE_245_length_2566_cov_4.511341:1742-2134(+)